MLCHVTSISIFRSHNKRIYFRTSFHLTFIELNLCPYSISLYLHPKQVSYTSMIAMIIYRGLKRFHLVTLCIFLYIAFFNNFFFSPHFQTYFPCVFCKWCKRWWKAVLILYIHSSISHND